MDDAIVHSNLKTIVDRVCDVVGGICLWATEDKDPDIYILQWRGSLPEKKGEYWMQVVLCYKALSEIKRPLEVADDLIRVIRAL